MRRRTRGRSAARRPCPGPTPARRGSGTAPRRRLASAALAARWGDPLFSANAIQPLRNYEVLVRHYRDEYARHGHDPRFAYVGAGAGALFIADTTQQARELYGPVYEALVAATNVPGNNSPFRDIDHAIAEGPALVGSPQQVIDKIGRFHGALGHDLQSISLPTTLPVEQQVELARALRRRGRARRAPRVPEHPLGAGRPVRAAPGGQRRRPGGCRGHRRGRVGARRPPRGRSRSGPVTGASGVARTIVDR